MSTTIGLDFFLADRARYLAGTTTQAAPGVDFCAARMHYESTDTWASLSGCREWRGCLRMSALDGGGTAPDVEVGVVHFLILQAGYESPTDTLPAVRRSRGELCRVVRCRVARSRAGRG